MLKRHAQFLKSLLFFFDLGLICACWIGAYYLRFSEILEPAPKGIPPLEMYLWLLLPIVAVWGVSFQVFDLYRPRRMGTRLAEFLDVAKANTLSVLILVVGAGRLGCRAADSIARHPELGVRIRGFLSGDLRKSGDRIEGIPVLGSYADLHTQVCQGIDIVFVCLPPEDEQWAEKVFATLSDTTVEVKALPAICEFMSLRAEVEMFEGLPIITLQGSPLHGWNLVIKRAMDIIGAAAALVLFAPVLLMVGGLVKMTSPGPVFFRQVRMGLDGRAFEMLKFRSMRADAESATGPVWARPDDDRRTPIGAFLRRTSLDELPQFWNVLKGQMSIVGPRPERPEFITRFRETLPQYMLRHKMKAGITGWAQVNGWRGNTSLEKRIEHDLYYIEHWSVWFDLKIILLTVWRGFIHKHAY